MFAFLPLVTVAFTLTLGALLVMPAVDALPMTAVVVCGCACLVRAQASVALRCVQALGVGVVLATVCAWSATRLDGEAASRLPAGLCVMRITGGARPANEAPVYQAHIVQCRATETEAWQSFDHRVTVMGVEQSWLMTAGDDVLLRVEPRTGAPRLHEYAWNSAVALRAAGLDGAVVAAGEAIWLGSAPGWNRAIDRLRLHMERAVLTRMSGRERGVTLAMLTGSRGELDDDLRRTFAATGAAHVLAVSGMHLVLICQGAFWLLRLALIRVPWIVERIGARRAAVLVLVPMTIAYVQLTGAPASAVRAGIMMVLMLLAEWWERPGAGLHALCGSIVLMLAWCPWWVFDAGFQLSVAATGSLVVHARVYKPKRAAMPWWKSATWGVVDSLRVSTVASFGTAPVLLWHFGEMPWLSPLTNLIVVPALSSITMPVSAVAALLEVARVPGTPILWWVVQWSAWFSLWASDAFGGVLSESIVWGRPSVMGLLGWTTLACTSPWLMERRRMGRAVVLSGAMLLLDLPPGTVGGHELQVHAIPVGQGDCTLVEFPDGTTLLVDAGGAGREPSSTGLRAVLPWLRAHGIGRVDIVAVTHADADHLAGLDPLWALVRPREVWVPAFDPAAPLVQQFLRSTAREGLEVRSIGHLQRSFALGGARVEWLGTSGYWGDNDLSLVLRICHGAACALLSGDIEAPREERMLQQGIDLRATYLKVPHHGSRSSSTERWLDAVRPAVAVMHLGHANRFGFPHAEVVERMQRRRVTMVRTDEGRSPSWVTDGERWWWQPIGGVRWTRLPRWHWP